MSWIWQAQGGGNGGGGGAVAKVPALQPNLYGAVAMYSLHANLASRNVLGIDRTGNGNTLQTVNAFAIPDYIPGQTVSQNYIAGNQSLFAMVAPSGQSALADYAGLKLVGEMTITCRAMQWMYPTAPVAGVYMYLVGHGLYNPATVQQLYSLVVHQATNRLTYYAYNGLNLQFDSTLEIGDGKWHFVSLRRAPSGVVTIGVDGVYQSSGVLGFPAVLSGASRFFVGRYGVNGVAESSILPNAGFIGAMADVCVWPRYLTDAELVPLRNVAMGL